MYFPFDDWQFWTVTAATVGALWMLVRPFLQRDSSAAPGACGNCAQATGDRCGSHEKRDRLVVLGGDR